MKKNFKSAIAGIAGAAIILSNVISIFAGSDSAFIEDRSALAAASPLEIVASDTIQYSSDSPAETFSDAYTKVKELMMTSDYVGSWRIKFDFAGDPYDDCAGTCYNFAQIYKNGAAYGTEYGNANIGYTTYSEDFTNISISSGDLIQLYIRAGSGVLASAQNFRIEFTDITPALAQNPDLAIESISYSPQNPTAGSPVTISLAYKNIGNAPITIDFPALLSAPGAITQTPPYQFSNYFLQPNEAGILTIPLIYNDPGTYNWSIILDQGNFIGDPNMANNQTSQSIAVAPIPAPVPAPDPAPVAENSISSLTFSSDSGSADAGKSKELELKLKLQNKKNVPIGFSCENLPQGTSCSFKDIEISGDEVKTKLYLNTSSRAITGQYQVSIVAEVLESGGNSIAKDYNLTINPHEDEDDD